MRNPIIGMILAVGLVWLFVMALALSFSLLFAKDADYCHAPLSYHEWVLPYRPLACLISDPTSEPPPE